MMDAFHSVLPLMTFGLGVSIVVWIEQVRQSILKKKGGQR